MTVRTSIGGVNAGRNGKGTVPSTAAKIQKPLIELVPSSGQLKPVLLREEMETQTWTNLTTTHGHEIALAVDTEYEGADTFTIQFAVRVGNEIRVQIYHAGGIPAPQSAWFGTRFQRQLTKLGSEIVVLESKPITPDLSPARVLADLLKLAPAEYLPRAEGEAKSRVELEEQPSKQQKDTKGLTVKLIGHFLRADFLRAFGQDFWKQLLLPKSQDVGRVSVRETRVIGLSGVGAEQFVPPVVEYVDWGATILPIRLSTFDTNVAFGSGTLGSLATSFLGVGKLGDVTDSEKGNMKAVFLRAPRRAYEYAAADVVLTLLLAGRMAELHKEIYKGLGFAENVPRCHATPGMRVANLILRDVAGPASPASTKTVVAEPTGGPASLRRIKELFSNGSASVISGQRGSRYGAQTGQTHGGLLINRSPAAPFHSAPGQFRDLDLSSCYPSILREMNVYVGRPVILEPGNEALTLKDVMGFLEREAAGWDGWFVKVTGAVSVAPNALIPSTNDALTHQNYKSRAARKRSGAAQQRFRPPHAVTATAGGYTSLFTDEISAGVVVWATWKMIQALPPEQRREYENLRVETVVFYPKAFVADSWSSLDVLQREMSTSNDLDWAQRLDLNARTLTTVDDLDEKYACLRYPIGKLAAHLVKMRQEAKKSGQGTAMEKALKLMANTLYGTICSPHLPTQNVVAAQVVTGTARALAFAMTQALNAHNVITDGVIYRRDQIPAGTFAECLKANPNFPIERSEGGLAFLNTTRIPVDESAFNTWYVKHVKRFFGVHGKDYQFLFGLHELAHKRLAPSESIAFDGLCLDGAANYAKLRRSAGKWEVAEFKARSFRSDDKKRLGEWLLEVCSKDHFTTPPDPVESCQLLTWRDAISACRRAVGRVRQAIVPLGMNRPRLQTYKLIKLSQFLFRNARQKQRIEAEWKKLVDGTACGPEILATKKGYHGSVAAVARALNDLIRSGNDRLRALNTHRILAEPDGIGPLHAKAVAVQRAKLEKGFTKALDTRKCPDGALITGLSLDRNDAIRMSV